MKVIYLLGFLFIICFTSCEENDIKKEKKFYESGNLKEIIFYNKSNMVDSIISYYDTNSNNKKQKISLKNGLRKLRKFSREGELIKEGLVNKEGQKVGKWINYIGDTTKVYEYLNINGKEYLNQTWIKNQNGDTIEGNYYQLSLKDTVFVNEVITLRLFYKEPIISLNSEIILLLPKSNEILADFSNINQSKLDTIFSLEHDEYNNHLQDLPLNHMLMTKFQFSKPGNKKIRGILKELYNPKNDSISLKERVIYFDENIFVKEDPMR